MPTATFKALVVNGQLRHQAMLGAFEGQQVDVTLNSVPQPSVQAEPREPASDEPPEWLDVEKDIYVKMPRTIEILENVKVVEGGPMQPRFIPPEELPDD